MGGIDTARLTPHAKLEIVNGMGHDLPEELLPAFIELISKLAGESAARQLPSPCSHAKVERRRMVNSWDFAT
jgi:hypothetical protein